MKNECIITILMFFKSNNRSKLVIFRLTYEMCLKSISFTSCILTKHLKMRFKSLYMVFFIATFPFCVHHLSFHVKVLEIDDLRIY